jgi:DNA-binding response OmpR family regulator
MSKQILLVDDDALFRRSLAFSLEQQGYHSSTAASAEEAFELVRLNSPDLVLLDIGLPGMDGLGAMHYFQEEYHLPVIIITARRRELDEILGMELGADDYITKPVNFDVLASHIKAVLRRTAPNGTSGEWTNLIKVGDLVIDAAAHTVTLAGKPIELTPREFDLLVTLATEAGRVVPVSFILNRVWGVEYMGESQVVYVHIRWLREKIEKDPTHPQKLITVRGIGYKLEANN